MHRFKRLLTCSLWASITAAAIVPALAASSVAPATQTTLQALEVESIEHPLGIDVEIPKFSWRMGASEQRGLRQAAYQIVVTRSGERVWDSGKVAKADSINVAYAGAPLKPSTRYEWTVTVWDNRGGRASQQSWFETGLLNPDPNLSAWSGASWIGGGDRDLVLHSDSLSVFDLSFSVAIAPGSEKASVVFAANDPRLMNRNQNMYGLESGHNQSYFKVELDVGPLGADPAAPARLNVYRAGYQASDDPTQPIKSFRINRRFIDVPSKHSPRRVSVRSEFGNLTLKFEGSAAFFDAEPGDSALVAVVHANPAGTTDVPTWGLLGDIGFALAPKQTATFYDLTVSNARAPANILFREDLEQQPYQGVYKRHADDKQSGMRVARGAYIISGGDKGALITADPSRNAMPMLRTTFALKSQKVTAARLYATARGIYELQLNGKRVGDDYFNPGFTQYNRTQLYQTYDVTDLLIDGQNALGAALGEGWWSGLLSYMPVWNHFGDRPSLLAKLVITYEDGSTDVVTSNGARWKYFNAGPIVYSSFYMGEVYDATREEAVEGWSTAGYDDSRWTQAHNVDLTGTAYRAPFAEAHVDATDNDFSRLAIVGQIGETAKVYKVLRAKSVKEVRKGVFVYDMGQNIVGVPRVRFANGKAGQRVTLRVAEILYPDLPASGANVGMIMTENYRAALSQDVYIMKAGPQVYQPRFTFHGYQYLEISGVESPPPVADVEGVVISSIEKLTAHYETSNAKVNQLWSNITWSNVDNFLSVPTDCPQRNERLGWSGDISVFARTATYLSDTGPFMRRHLRALRDTQHPSGRFADVAPLGGLMGGVLWGSAGITVAWETYLQYGDLALLREHYPAMVAYVDYLDRSIDPRTGISTDIELGDWLGPQNNQLGSAFPAAAYQIFDLDIVARVAALLGHREDATKYRKQYEQRKAFFNKTFVNADKKAVGYVQVKSDPNAPPRFEFRVADTQSAYAVGLALGAFSKENIPYMQRNLAAAVDRENIDDRGVARPRYSLMTGFIGTAWISEALSRASRSDLAYKLLQNNQYPSWLYPVDQGATTIWERLNSYTVDEGFGGNNGMNSFNHYAFGAVGQWMLAHSLGIKRDEPGFRAFVLEPEPDPTGEMTWAKGHYDSPYGRIESGWRVEGNVLTYTATVPANTRATLKLPTSSESSVKEGAERARRSPGVVFKRYEGGKAVYELASGTYRFTSTLGAKAK